MWKGPEGKKGRGSAGPQVRPLLAVRCGAPLSGTAAVPRLQALLINVGLPSISHCGTRGATPAPLLSMKRRILLRAAPCGPVRRAERPRAPGGESRSFLPPSLPPPLLLYAP